MLQYTKEQEKTVQEYKSLEAEAVKLEETLQTEEFNAEERTEKVLYLHTLKQAMSELLYTMGQFVPTEVADKPAKTIKLDQPLEPNESLD